MSTLRRYHQHIISTLLLRWKQSSIAYEREIPEHVFSNDLCSHHCCTCLLNALMYQIRLNNNISLHFGLIWDLLSTSVSFMRCFLHPFISYLGLANMLHLFLFMHHTLILVCQFGYNEKKNAYFRSLHIIYYFLLWLGSSES